MVDARLWGTYTALQVLREWSPSYGNSLWELTPGVVIFAGKRPSY